MIYWAVVESCCIQFFFDFSFRCIFTDTDLSTILSFARMTTVQKINEIEAEMARTQKNKATAHVSFVMTASLCSLCNDICIHVFICSIWAC